MIKSYNADAEYQNRLKWDCRGEGVAIGLILAFGVMMMSYLLL